ncbi:HNH endonuclease [Rhodococcus opacus]|uniref:HNH endonuclease n=1 Tax=Rhodococcus opacus TaxID=37919 RepID=UPI0012DB3BAF|nr:hypothetical protein [Rhodococcus opacus]
MKAARDFEAAASTGTTHLLVEADFRSRFAKDIELKKTYKNRMVGATSPGRAIYDEIKDAIEFNICPMCGHRPIAGLDHALPKEHFPLLAVTPSNLVPCCADCNHDKLESVAKREEDVFLHPYFDDVDRDVWLVADILESIPTGATFNVAAPGHWSPVLAERVRHHFDELGLANLYTAQAGSEIRALEPVMERAHGRNGSVGVREELVDHREGRRRLHNNSWQGALFDALILSDWYCSGGFRS